MKQAQELAIETGKRAEPTRHAWLKISGCLIQAGRINLPEMIMYIAAMINLSSSILSLLVSKVFDSSFLGKALISLSDAAVDLKLLQSLEEDGSFQGKIDSRFIKALRQASKAGVCPEKGIVVRLLCLYDEKAAEKKAAGKQDTAALVTENAKLKADLTAAEQLIDESNAKANLLEEQLKAANEILKETDSKIIVLPTSYPATHTLFGILEYTPEFLRDLGNLDCKNRKSCLGSLTILSMNGTAHRGFRTREVDRKHHQDVHRILEANGETGLVLRFGLAWRMICAMKTEKGSDTTRLRLISIYKKQSD